MKNSTLSDYRSKMYACFLWAGPFFVREWSSAYAACKDGVIDREALRKIRVNHAPKPRRPDKLGPGRPPEDGAVFRCKDPTTYGEADAHWEGTDDRGKRLEVDRRDGLHFQEARPITVSLLRVTRHGISQTLTV